MIAADWVLPLIIQSFSFFELYTIFVLLYIFSMLVTAGIITIFYRKIGSKIKADISSLNNSTQDEETKLARLKKNKKLARRLKLLVFVFTWLVMFL